MNFTLDAFIENVRSQSAQGSYDQLHAYCIKCMEHLGSFEANLNDAIAVLDPQEHSIGVLTTLCVKLTKNLNGFEENLLAQTEEFFSSCNSIQIRHAPDIFAELCHKYTIILLRNKCELRGLLHLQTAIQKVQAHATQLTSIHSDLCQLALVSKCIKPALEQLDIDFTEISKEKDSLDVQYFLQYYYYGGLIYATQKKFERSLYFFEVVLSTPAVAVSSIMSEAYKKYVLVSLILHGKVIPLPKYTSQVVSRHIRPRNFQYTELASAYSTNNIQEVSTVVSRHSDTFNRDHNMGLVKQCVTSLHKKNIQRLTKTFLTLSLADMAEKIQLPSVEEAERYILKMIEKGEIFASINQKDGMVVFLDNPEKYNTSVTLRKLESDMKICMELDNKLRHLEQEIATNPKYVHKTRNEVD